MRRTYHELARRVGDAKFGVMDANHANIALGGPLTASIRQILKTREILPKA